MSDSDGENKRVFTAMKAIADGRDPRKDGVAVMVTLEGVVAALMLMSNGGSPDRAVAMLHEGLVPGIEDRIALAAIRMRNESK